MNTKELILQSTLSIASEKGLGNVSLSQIADKVGIKKATLYSHFKSKDEIINSLYEYIRKKSISQTETSIPDYGKLIEGRKAEEILKLCIHNYMKINETKEMNEFYKFIISERVHNPSAAEIMTLETEKMVHATKLLFREMKAQEIISCTETDTLAYTFALAVNSLINYCYDKKICGINETKQINDFIDNFCKLLKH